MKYRLYGHCSEEIKTLAGHSKDHEHAIRNAFARLKELGQQDLYLSKKLKPLREGIQEYRFHIPDGIGRILLFLEQGVAHCVRCFVKKSQKTPPREIDTAISRMRIIKAN